MRFSFLILTYERSKGLLALLDSINRLERPVGAEFRVFIWDNAPKPGSLGALEASPLGSELGIVHLNPGVNTYMVGKLHLELAALSDWDGRSGDYAVHLDDDVQLDPKWLVETWSALERNRWDACGSVEVWHDALVYSGQTRLSIAQVSIGATSVGVWDWRWEPVRDGDAVTVEFAGHRAMLVRMPVIATVLHDPLLMIGGEDVDYSLALRAAGYSLGIAHRALIRHRQLGERDADGFRTRERVLTSWRRFYQKWGFIRRNASVEAGLDEQEWLRAVVTPTPIPSEDRRVARASLHMASSARV